MKKKGEEALIKKMLNLLIRQLKIDLKKHPFLLVNEHDLQAYLYTKLTNEKMCNQFVVDGDGDEIYRIHCEYARGEYKKGVGTPGRLQFDIAILKSNLSEKSIWYTQKPVWLGMELKLNIDRTKKSVIRDIDREDVAIEITKKGNKYADWAVLFHLNIAKGEYNEQDFKDIKNYLYKLKKDNKKTFYVYLETYRCKTKESFILF
jgi:hypothetical protein